MSGAARKTVLLTARSACAAWGLVEIWRVAAQAADLSLHVVAQEPAATIFAAEGVPFTRLDMPALIDADGAEARELLAWTRDHLAHLKPDVALVGLSVPQEGGIDEAVVAEAACPTFVLQDFWGDCNVFFGRYADCYLAPDAEGARMTRERHGARSIVLGSPRHARYAALDMAQTARSARRALGLAEEGRYLGLFCQPLWRFEGYRRTIEHWARAAREIGQTQIVYRPHPASGQEQIDAISTLLGENGLDARFATGGPIEHALAACAAVTSALSNSNIDAAYLNHFSPGPLVVPTYMIYEPDLKAYLDGFQDATTIPAVRQGLAHVALSRDALAPMLADALSAETAQEVWRAARQLPNPVEALALAVDVLRRPAERLAEVR